MVMTYDNAIIIFFDGDDDQRKIRNSIRIFVD